VEADADLAVLLHRLFFLFSGPLVLLLEASRVKDWRSHVISQRDLVSSKIKLHGWRLAS
jgi:hypothetical protein